MKYKDKHTIKSTYRWQNKPESDNVQSKINSVKTQLKRLIIPFGKKISDTFWWNSLTQKQQITVYVEYCEFEYYNSDNYWFLPSTPYYVPTFPTISDEEHELRINFLKQKYSDSSKRRNLVINDILNS